MLRRFPLAFVYHLSGLVLGSLYFTVLVTGWSVALTTAIIAALPVLLAFSLVVRGCAVDRACADLRAARRPRRPVLAPRRPEGRHRPPARLADQRRVVARAGVPAAALPARAWRSGSSPISAVAGAIWLLAAPLFAPLVKDMYDFGFWDPNTFVQGLALVPIGLVLAALSVPLVDGMGLASRRMAE